MAKLLGSLQITATDVTVVGVPGAGTLSVEWQHPTVTVSEGGGSAEVRVRVKDSEGVLVTSPTEFITVPFEVTAVTDMGTEAVRGVDYEIAQSDGGTAQTLPFIRIDAGPASGGMGGLFIEPLDTDNRPDSAELTFSIELKESVTVGGDTYTLGQGGTGSYDIGTNDTLSGTVNTASAVSDPVIGFVDGAARSVVEPSTGTLSANVSVAIAGTPETGCSCTYTFSGTAVKDTDFTTQDEHPSGTLTWGPGDTLVKRINLDVINNPATGADKTVIVTLSGLSGCTIDSAGLVHTTTIEDVDAPETIYNVGFEQPAVTLAEGSGAAYQVAVNIQNPGDLPADNQHTAIVIPVTVAVTSTAEPGVDYTTTLDTEVIINDGQTRGRFEVTPVDNGVMSSPNKFVKFTLGNPTGPAALGLTRTQSTTITFADNDGSSSDVDDIPYDYTGTTKLCAQRVQFDVDDPDIELYLDGVTRTSDGTSLSTTTSENPSGEALLQAIAWAHDIHNASDVPLADRVMGSEGTLVTIRVHPGTSGNPNNSTEGYENAFKRLNIGLAAHSTRWSTTQTDVGRAVMRDLVFYGSHLSSGSTADWPRMKGPSIYPEAFYLDNVRWEGIWFAAEGLSGVGSTYGFRLHTGSGPAQGSHGSLKLYDCRYRTYLADVVTNATTGDVNAPVDGYYQSSAVAGFYRAHWDIRNQPGHPYPFGEEAREHCSYIWSPQGSDTYAGLTRPHVFLGLENEGRFPPNNDQHQFSNRKNQAPGPVGNGKMVFIRGVMRGCGAQGMVIWGHDGEVYIKDMEVLPGTLSGSCGAGLNITHEYSGTHEESSSSAGTPGGAYPLSTLADRWYTTEKVVIDGLTINSPNMGQRHPIQLIGVDHVEWIKFWIQNNGKSAAQIAVNKQNLLGVTGQSQSPMPGLCFTSTWGVSNLVRPSDGVAATWNSSYEGWGSGTKMQDGYHQNWYQDEDNYATLDNDAVDSYVAIVLQQYNNRLTATGDGLGTISHADWTGSSTPKKPRLTWPAGPASDGVTYYGEPSDDTTHTIKVDMLAASMCIVRAKYEITSVDAALGTAGSDDGVNYFNLEPASPEDIDVPQDDDDDWEPVNYGGNTATTSDWSRQDRLELTLSLWGTGGAGEPSALSTGSKDIDVALEESSADPAWDYPKGAGAYTDTLPDGANKTGTFRIVPKVDFPTLTLSATQEVQLDDLPATVPVTVTRTASANNADSVKLVSTADTAVSALTAPAGTVTASASSLSFAADDLEQTFNVTIGDDNGLGTILVSLNNLVNVGGSVASIAININDIG